MKKSFSYLTEDIGFKAKLLDTKKECLIISGVKVINTQKKLTEQILIDLSQRVDIKKVSWFELFNILIKLESNSNYVLQLLHKTLPVYSSEVYHSLRTIEFRYGSIMPSIDFIYNNWDDFMQEDDLYRRLFTQ